MGTFSEILDITSSLGGAMRISRSGASRVAKKHTLAAAISGTVTSINTGAALLTLSSGHGITTAMKVGVFWSGGQRLEMTVTAVDTTTITVTASTGVGTAFPSANTAIVVSAASNKSDVAFAAANMQMLTVSSPGRSAANFLDNTSTSLLAIAIADPSAQGNPGEGYAWAANTGVPQPMTATVASVSLYNGTTSAQDVTIGVLIA